jgi:hypothetical protein
LRIHNPKSEIESNKPFPTQPREMVTVMIYHNPALSVQLLWSLNMMEEEIELGFVDGTPLNNIYLRGRYVLDCLKDSGFLCSRWQFNANMKMIKTIMIEGTKTEDGETHGVHTIGRHTQNQFIAFVGMHITNDTPGIKIIRAIRFLSRATRRPTSTAPTWLCSIPPE